MGKLLRDIDRTKLPLFVGAGVIKSKAAIYTYSAIPELAVQVIGSFSRNEWGGNDPSGEKTVFWWDAANHAAYNAIGLKNCGQKAASAFLPKAIERVHEAGQVAIVAITSVIGEDPVSVLPDMAAWALAMGADGVEMNGSCPNEGPHNVLCTDTSKSQQTIDAVRAKIGDEPYLMFKVSPLSARTIQWYKNQALAVDAVTAVNNCRRLSPKDPATKKFRIEVNDGYAGQSGPIIKNLARENLAYWRATGGQSYDIWSIGGVDSGAEIYKRIHAGAFLAGGAQAFYRAPQPEKLASRWTAEYRSLVKK